MNPRNFLAYWRCGYRNIVPITVIFLIALALPPFQLFEERATGMLQSHLVLELFAIMVAILIAVVSWHNKEPQKNAESAVLMAGFALAAFLDFVHALSYDGMPKLVTDSSTVKAIFFWLAGRTVVVLTLLPVALNIKLVTRNSHALALALLLAVGLFWIGTFRLDLVPVTFVQGSGVTRFKSNYEYGLFIADLVLAGLFIGRASLKNQERSFALATSCLIMAMGEIIFSDYKAPSDFLNNFGHVFKVMSYAFLYQTVFVSAISAPYERIQDSDARFQALTDLSSDWLWEQDKNFRFIEGPEYIANTATSMFAGKTRWELYPQGATPEQWQSHRQQLERHESFKDFIYQVELAPGQLRWLSASGIPIFDKQGEFTGYRGVGSDITHRKQAEKQIEHMAYHDALTGLPNRLLLQDRFEQARAAAMRSQTKCLLLYMDVDNFKDINDSLGHHVGDKVLVQVAQRLKSALRDSDTLSRQGGDEFLILLTQLGRVDDALPVVLKLLEQLQQPFNSGENEVSTSISMGIAVYPDDGQNFESICGKADIAMYKSKDAGRNTYRFFDEAMDSEAARQIVVRNGLRHALARHELTLHYQPQISLASGQVVGVEALIRWNHPELGQVPPMQFIPVAEQSGLIVQIGAWVLEQACQQAVAWQQLGLGPFTMAVNISAMQFRRGDLEQTVHAALEKSGLEPRYLELELTESILIQNDEKVLVSIRRLKALGISLSIDDFGTGYSSLSYLKRFAVDKLKIDKSFVSDMDIDMQNAAIVKAVIQMAQGIGLEVIAEGVETETARQHLADLGCDVAQGYLISRPISASAMDHFLSSWAPSGAAG